MRKVTMQSGRSVELEDMAVMGYGSDRTVSVRILGGNDSLIDSMTIREFRELVSAVEFLAAAEGV